MKFTKDSYIEEDFSKEEIDMYEIAGIQFTRCKFRWTDFSEVETIFKCVFDTCDFTSVRLNGVVIKSAGFLSCKFAGAAFFATKFEECKMLGSDFRNSDCTLLQIDGGDWSYTNLHKLSFQKQDFIGIRFLGADLTETHFNQCKMSDCEFDEALVHETSFYRCDMRTSSLGNMSLFEVSLKEALLDIAQCVSVAEYFTGCRYKATDGILVP